MRFSIIAIFIPLLCFTDLFSQSKPILSIDRNVHDYGIIEEANSLISEFKITNNGKGRLFLMRADAPRGYLVNASNKYLQEGESTILTIRIKPESPGVFETKIALYTNASNEPLTLTLKGNILKISPNPTACYSFSNSSLKNSVSPATFEVKGTVADKKSGKPVKALIKFSSGTTKDETFTHQGIFSTALTPNLYTIKISAPGYINYTERVYLNPKSKGPLNFFIDPLSVDTTSVNLSEQNSIKADTLSDSLATTDNDTFPVGTGGPSPIEEKLPENLYKPNNITFILDISGSMKDSLKLPLLKTTLSNLFKVVRPIDKISILAYSDSSRILTSGLTGNNQHKLDSLIKGLKAKGYTAAAQAINKAYFITKEHYIPEGNNEIILSTDGIFKLTPEEEKLFSDSTITLSVVAFGNDKWALGRLQKLSTKTNGSFTLIKSKEEAQDAVIDHIKVYSRKD